MPRTSDKHGKETSERLKSEANLSTGTFFAKPWERGEIGRNERNREAGIEGTRTEGGGGKVIKGVFFIEYGAYLSPPAD